MHFNRTLSCLTKQLYISLEATEILTGSRNFRFSEIQETTWNKNQQERKLKHR